ncbi:MAG: nucleotidyltransferase domain-containing protein [Oscillospiraceae bacterium]|nr:nucleotidyltransferase domain-containing protein [Oscillospiraceae bacterium]
MQTDVSHIEAVACNVLRSYPVKRAAFFGSAARGNISDKSDIDMLIEFLPGRGGANFEFFGLRTDLEEAFNRPVDLITFYALEHESKVQFRKNVLSDLRIIYEREN